MVFNVKDLEKSEKIALSWSKWEWNSLHWKYNSDTNSSRHRASDMKVLSVFGASIYYTDTGKEFVVSWTKFREPAHCKLLCLKHPLNDIKWIKCQIRGVRAQSVNKLLQNITCNISIFYWHLVPPVGCSGCLFSVFSYWIHLGPFFITQYIFNLHLCHYHVNQTQTFATTKTSGFSITHSSTIALQYSDITKWVSRGKQVP